MNDALSLRAAGLMVFASSAAIVLTAFAFEHIGGLRPCVLCWWQRYPYFVTIALSLVAASLAPDRPRIATIMLGLCGVAFLAGAGIAAFHVGVEQKWWEGTAACGSNFGPAGSIDELRRRLLEQPIVRCDEVAWSLFGISMAGYNFVLSLALAALSFHAARPALRLAPR